MDHDDQDDATDPDGCCPDCTAGVPLPARHLSPGDLITETTTPGGPWHLVAEIHPDAGVVVLDAGDGLLVPIAFAAGHAVLKAPRCEEEDA